MSLDTTPSPRQIAAIDRSQRSRVTGRLKQALDAMVWDGLTDNAAAVSAKMNVLSIRIALRKPHVRAYYLRELEVLKAREGPANIHALMEVRDQKENQMARVNAAKALMHQEDSPQRSGAAAATPGLVVIIGNTPNATANMVHDMGKVIDATNSPMISEGAGGQGIRSEGGGGGEPSPRAAGRPGGKSAID